jgi:hypothetical protein
MLYNFLRQEAANEFASLDDMVNMTEFLKENNMEIVNSQGRNWRTELESLIKTGMVSKVKCYSSEARITN